MLFAYALACLALAGRAMALTIDLGGSLGNVTATQLFVVPEGPLKTTCAPSCTLATNAIQTCGDTNDACLCSNVTAAALTTCEECMFTELIALNQPMPDLRVGSTPALGAYAAACLSANITVPKSIIALALPDNWDGPQSLHLSTGLTVVAVLFGGFFGISALLIMANI